ncbi:MAG: transposase [Bacteroidetes bacterium]|nr:transposase [Bacteroidota bacterium]
MDAVAITKRSYHPLVLFFYYSKLLTNDQLAQIPDTTIAYWDKNKLEFMFGSDWVKGVSADYENFSKTQKRKIVAKAAKLCLKTLACISSVLDKTGNIQGIMKKNAKKVIDTIDYLVTEMPVKKACRIFKISTNQYFRWKNKIYCTASVLNLCFKTHPHQLTIAEATCIKEAINNPEYKYLPGVSIYYSLLNAGKLFCSITTFYKYAQLLFVGEKLKRPKEPKVRLFASRPFEYLHIDTTLIPTLKGGTKRVVFVKDNFSKALLHKVIVPDGKSVWIADVLKETFIQHHLMNYKEPIHIISDKGSENRGEVLKWIDQFEQPNMVIKKTVGEDHFKYYNNEVESAFHIFKNEFSRDKIYNDTADLQNGIDEFYIYFNEKRYPKELYGLTPQQVLNGEIPDKNRFKEQIKAQKGVRYQKNKSAKFCDVCS